MRNQIKLLFLFKSRQKGEVLFAGWARLYLSRLNCTMDYWKGALCYQTPAPKAGGENIGQER